MTPVAVDNPPSAPTSLAASASGSSGVNLSWTAATDDNGVRRTRWSAARGRAARGSCRWRRRRRRRWRTRVWQASTSYSYRVRARDTGNQVGPYSNVASATTRSAPPPPSSTLVAAYAFDEGSGSSVADLSGNGNTGRSGRRRGRRRASTGRRCTSTGRAARVRVPDAASLDLTTAVTLEAWVYPAAAQTGGVRWCRRR